jgi:hypothetical protein
MHSDYGIINNWRYDGDVGYRFISVVIVFFMHLGTSLYLVCLAVCSAIQEVSKQRLVASNCDHCKLLAVFSGIFC